MIPLELDQLLRVRIPDDLHLMMEMAKQVDGYRYVIINELSTANRELIEAENANQLIKTPKLTEADRKFHVEFRTRDQREKVELLSGTLACIDRRINLIQTLIKPETEAYKRS